MYLKCNTNLLYSQTRSKDVMLTFVSFAVVIKNKDSVPVTHFPSNYTNLIS